MNYLLEICQFSAIQCYSYEDLLLMTFSNAMRGSVNEPPRITGVSLDSVSLLSGSCSQDVVIRSIVSPLSLQRLLTALHATQVTWIREVSYLF